MKHKFVEFLQTPQSFFHLYLQWLFMMPTNEAAGTRIIIIIMITIRGGERREMRSCQEPDIDPTFLSSNNFLGDH